MRAVIPVFGELFGGHNLNLAGPLLNSFSRFVAFLAELALALSRVQDSLWTEGGRMTCPVTDAARRPVGQGLSKSWPAARPAGTPCRRWWAAAGKASGFFDSGPAPGWCSHGF